MKKVSHMTAGVKNNAMHGDVPSWIIIVMVVNMSIPCGKAMVTFPDIVHLPGELLPVRIGQELILESIVRRARL